MLVRRNICGFSKLVFFKDDVVLFEGHYKMYRHGIYDGVVDQIAGMVHRALLEHEHVK